MPIYDIFKALDYHGGIPSAGQVMAVDANGNWTASTVTVLSSTDLTLSGSINAAGVNASLGYIDNLTASGTVNAVGANVSNGFFGNSINATGVNASTGYINNLTASASLNAAGANASIGNLPKVYIATLLSVGNRVVQASGASLGFFRAPSVGQQASISVLKVGWAAADITNSATIGSIIDSLTLTLNSLGTYLNALGFTA